MVLGTSKRQSTKEKAVTPAADLQPWTSAISQQAMTSRCLTVGILSGARTSNDRRIIDTLAKALSESLHESMCDPRMLMIRLDVQVQRFKSSVARLTQSAVQTPRPAASPLGRWHVVDIAMPVKSSAAPTLESLPRWLPEWKETFGTVLIDLGPINLPPARLIGRLCDTNYVMLGPDACGSHDWLLQHIDWHARSGSHVDGCLTSTVSRAA